jgi:hypothetical protein
MSAQLREMLYIDTQDMLVRVLLSTGAVEMAAQIPKIMDTTSYISMEFLESW